MSNLDWFLICASTVVWIAAFLVRRSNKRRRMALGLAKAEDYIGVSGDGNLYIKDVDGYLKLPQVQAQLFAAEMIAKAHKYRG